MIKRVAMFSLAKGVDPDEVWKFYSEIHAPGIASRTPSLRKYVINRVISGMGGREKGVGREPKWWSMLEQWYDSEEDFLRTYTPPDRPRTSNTPISEEMAIWSKYMGKRFGEAIVEEKIIVKNPIPEIHCKRIGVFGLPEGRDPDEAWRYWVDIHAVNFKDTMPGVRLYAINRVIKTPAGTPSWWGILEQRFDSQEACEQALATPRPRDEFSTLYMDREADASGLAYVEEKVIV